MDSSIRVDTLKADIDGDLLELWSYCDGGWDIVQRIKGMVDELCKIANTNSPVTLYVCIRDHLTPSMDEYSVGDYKWLNPSQITISKVLPCWRKARRKEMQLLIDGKEKEMRELVKKSVSK
jgi:hypothetical protein